MGLDFLILAVVVVGLFSVFRLRGEGARRLKLGFVYGGVLALGGCVVALGWLGAETSGSDNVFHGLSPLVWVGAFVIGVVVLVVVSIVAVSVRAREKQASERDEG